MFNTMIKKMAVTLAMVITLAASPSLALDSIHTWVPQAKKTGQGVLTYLFWDIYEVSLYAPNGIWTADKPFALRLLYLRKLEGKKIADHSVKAMRQQGSNNETQLTAWHTQLRTIFPDVEHGISLTGVKTATEATIFYQGNKEIGRITDAEFSRAFFNIWLGENTLTPHLRRQLLGMP